MSRRVLLKISGESLCESGGSGLDAEVLAKVGLDLTEAVKAGLQIGLVVGGGNFLRGAQLAPTGIERSTADFMGMLATVMNGLAVQAAIEGSGGRARVVSAIDVGPRVEPFVQRRCVEYLEAGEIVVLVGGTGHPYFTTDTCAGLRAVELGAELLLKGTKVDGIYSGDPKKDPSAELYRTLSYEEVLAKRLKVMDSTAIALCQEHGLPILVFNLLESGNLKKALHGEDIGTRVS